MCHHHVSHALMTGGCTCRAHPRYLCGVACTPTGNEPLFLALSFPVVSCRPSHGYQLLVYVPASCRARIDDWRLHVSSSSPLLVWCRLHTHWQRATVFGAELPRRVLPSVSWLPAVSVCASIMSRTH